MKKEKLLEKVLNKLKEEKLFYKKIDMEKLQDIIFNILEETTENVDDSVRDLEDFVNALNIIIDMYKN